MLPLMHSSIVGSHIHTTWALAIASILLRPSAIKGKETYLTLTMKGAIVHVLHFAQLLRD